MNQSSLVRCILLCCLALVVPVAGASDGQAGSEPSEIKSAPAIPSPPRQGTGAVPETGTPQMPASDAPPTITVTTGGGSKIDRFGFLLTFGKQPRRFSYPDAPALEQQVNAALQAAGYRTDTSDRSFTWKVTTVALGDPATYAPRGDGHEEAKAAFEKAGNALVGLLIGLATRSANMGSNVAGGPTIDSPNAKYITKDMVDGLPPGATKILLTRVVNASAAARAQQEILTVAYGPISDDTLREINSKHLLDMLGIKLNPGDPHASNSAAVATGDDSDRLR